MARVALEGISALAKTSGKTIVKKTRPSQQASVACGWAGAVMGAGAVGGAVCKDFHKKDSVFAVTFALYRRERK